MASQGQSVAEAIRAIGVSEVTYYRWRQEYGGLKSDQVKRLKELRLLQGHLHARHLRQSMEAGVQATGSTRRQHPQHKDDRTANPEWPSR